MLLTRTAEYALRLMALLARAYADREPVNSQMLAAEASVPPAYVSKILRKLVIKNLLRAEKGHRGGFLLARPPKRINFNDIFEALGESYLDAECAFGWGTCSSADPCMLHRSWTGLKSTLERWARSSTLDTLL